MPVISEHTVEPPIAKSNDAVFQWRAKSIWRKALLKMFPEVLTKKVVAHILANRPEFFVSDELSWIERPARDLTGLSTPLFEEFDRRFPLRFPFIRVFHAGRPFARDDYRKSGLRLLGLEHLKTQAVEIFGESPALQKAMDDLDDGISRYSEGSGKKIFFCLDRREAVRGSGHYLKYGSEYLLGIAARLHQESALTSRGIPILVHVNLPYFWVDSSTRRELMGTMFEDLFCYLSGDPFSDYNGLNFSFPIHRTVPPNLFSRLEKVTDIRTRR